MDKPVKTQEDQEKDWDKEFEEFLNESEMNEESKEAMRNLRDFANGLLNNDPIALEVFEKIKEKLPLPFQMNESEIDKLLSQTQEFHKLQSENQKLNEKLDDLQKEIKKLKDKE